MADGDNACCCPSKISSRHCADDVSEESEERKVVFDPPLYIQRYNLVNAVLREDPWMIDQVVDFGCAEGKFLRRARNCLGDFVDVFIGVDADEEVLLTAAPYLEPKPDTPFSEERTRTETFLYKGSVGEYDDRLRCADAVVAIELIEHLYEDALSALPDVIFGRIQPYVAVFTTPNVEFNVLFDMGERRFRHDDHKFEWNRAEFREWCSTIVRRYPQYSVTYTGVGIDSHGSPLDRLGFCSQAAVFRWNDKTTYLDLKELKRKEIKRLTESKQRVNPYEMVAKIIDAPKFTAARMNRAVSDCRIFCLGKLEEARLEEFFGVWISLDEMLQSSNFLKKLCDDADTLAEVIMNRDDYSWKFTADWDNYRIYCEVETPSYDGSDEEEAEQEALGEVETSQ